MKREPGEEIGPSLECSSGSESIQFEHPRRRVVLIGGDVPVPVTFAGSLHSERVALFREPERLLSTLVRMDVADRSDHPRRPSPFVAHAKAAAVHPAVSRVQLAPGSLAVIDECAPGNAS